MTESAPAPVKVLMENGVRVNKVIQPEPEDLRVESGATSPYKKRRAPRSYLGHSKASLTA